VVLGLLIASLLVAEVVVVILAVAEVEPVDIYISLRLT